MENLPNANCIVKSLLLSFNEIITIDRQLTKEHTYAHDLISPYHVVLLRLVLFYTAMLWKCGGADFFKPNYHTVFLVCGRSISY